MSRRELTNFFDKLLNSQMDTVIDRINMIHISGVNKLYRPEDVRQNVQNTLVIEL